MKMPSEKAIKQQANDRPNYWQYVQHDGKDQQCDPGHKNPDPEEDRLKGMKPDCPVLVIGRQDQKDNARQDAQQVAKGRGHVIRHAPGCCTCACSRRRRLIARRRPIARRCSSAGSRPSCAHCCAALGAKRTLDCRSTIWTESHFTLQISSTLP